MNAPLNTQNFNQNQNQNGEGDTTADLFDYTQIKNWAGFVFNSLGRHRVLGVICFVLVVSASVGAAVFLPRKYVSSTKILTRQTNIISALSNPYRGVRRRRADPRGLRNRHLAGEPAEDRHPDRSGAAVARTPQPAVAYERPAGADADRQGGAKTIGPTRWSARSRRGSV